MRQAYAAQEVLLKWRGFVPVEVMSVVDENGTTVSKNLLDYMCLHWKSLPLERSFKDAFMDNERYILQKQKEWAGQDAGCSGQRALHSSEANGAPNVPQGVPHNEQQDKTQDEPEHEPPGGGAYQQDEQANQQDDPPQGEANQQDGTQEHPLRATEAHRGSDPDAVRLFYAKVRKLEKECMRNLDTNALWNVVQGTIDRAEYYRHKFGDAISLSKFSGCSQQLTTEVPDHKSLTRKRQLKNELARQLDVVKSNACDMKWEHGCRLIALLEDEGSNGVTLEDVLKAKMLSPFSIEALSMNSVSYPPNLCSDVVFPEMLLAEKDFIVLPPGHRPGSLIGTQDADETAPKCNERHIIDEEERTGKPSMWWADWWLSLLGFKDTGERYVRAYVRTYVITYAGNRMRSRNEAKDIECGRGYVRTYARTFVRTCVRTYIYRTYVPYVITYTYVRTYIRTYVRRTYVNEMIMHGPH